MSSFQKMLSVAMEERTRAAHERLIHHPFEKAISSGQFNREQYVQYLSDFHAIFSAIESRVQAWPREMSGVWDARLARTSNIAKDLEYFDATPSRPAPSASAAKYAMYIQSLSAEQLHLLIAHIWTQYGKEMAGGQYFKHNVQKRAAALVGNKESGTGALLYEFDIPQLRVWRQSWRAAMDAVPLTPAQQNEVVEESHAAFLLTEELLPNAAQL